jgi:hypothetical protein
MTQRDQGLDADDIEKEVAVPLPERDAMSLIDPAGTLIPIADATIGADGPPTIAPEDQVKNLPPVE